jgi:DNA-binding IclR family transcriptional regulator
MRTILKEGPKILSSVQLSLQVMKCFTIEKPVWGIRELARELDQSHTKIFRILETMKEEGFAVQNPETKKYSLGTPYIELGNLVKKQFNVEEELRPCMIELRDALDESIFFTVINQRQGKTLIAVDSQQGVKFTAFEGSSEPLYAGASYRAILAYQSPEFIQEVLSEEMFPYTEKTILDKEIHYEKLAEIRKQGYAISYGEYTRDVCAIAFPIRDASSEVRASLTISGPLYRISEEKQQDALNIGKVTQGKIEHILKRSNIYF